MIQNVAPARPPQQYFFGNGIANSSTFEHRVGAVSDENSSVESEENEASQNEGREISQGIIRNC